MLTLMASKAQAHCARCALRACCLPESLGTTEINRFSALVGVRRGIRRGQVLYRAGEPFGAVYVVRSGCFKTTVLTGAGHNQVTGFQMAGENLGADGISRGTHTCDAEALEDSEVCRVPFSDLENLSREVPALQHHFHKVMSREIVRAHGVMMYLGTMRAEESLAAFLLDLSRRLAALGLSADDIQLAMTREEIGSHLGLQLQTVSRTFSRLHDLGVIAVQHRHIRIIDAGRLKALTVRTPATANNIPRPSSSRNALWRPTSVPSLSIRQSPGSFSLQ
jgi:CRP/FNR family transcriptional regulator